MRLSWIPIVGGFAFLNACGPSPSDSPATENEVETESIETVDPSSSDEVEETGPESGSLEWATNGSWRELDGERDAFRNPVETLTFFQVDPSSRVLEVWPGAGWYTAILAPWVEANGGSFTAAFVPGEESETRAQLLASYQARFDDPLYGEVEIVSFENGSLDITPGSVDTILSFRNVHNWMAGGDAESAFASFHDALAPGGTLGVVAHRLPASVVQDPRANSGYVQEDVVIALAEEAGFELVGRSDINANPADTSDHPFGVWTLPPNLRTAPVGEDANPDFDTSPYEAIGESDRMTLLFRKPAPEPVENESPDDSVDETDAVEDDDG